MKPLFKTTHVETLGVLVFYMAWLEWQIARFFIPCEAPHIWEEVI